MGVVAERRIVAGATALAVVVAGMVWWVSGPDPDGPPVDPVQACRDAVAKRAPAAGWLGADTVVRQGPANVTVDGRAETASGPVSYRCLVGSDGRADVLHVG